MKSFIKKMREFLGQDFSGLIIAIMLAIGLLWTIFSLISVVAGVLAKMMPHSLAIIITIMLFVGVTLLIYGFKIKPKTDRDDDDFDD